VGLWASIVAGNTADKGPDVLGPLYLVYPSLIQNTSDTAISFGDTTVPIYSVGAALSKKSIFGQSPKLGPLRNNGGATQTLALLPGSPAIGPIPLYNTSSGDISICGSSFAELPDVSTTDQRGSKRPGDHKKACDLGAYESAG
jgi:hypothetical protein